MVWIIDFIIIWRFKKEKGNKKNNKNKWFFIWIGK